MTRLNGSCPLARYEIASGSTIVSGDIVALNASGKAVPAANTANLTVIGVAERVADNAVIIADGIVGLANDTTGALTRADRGRVAYVKDAVTVAKTGTNSIVAGIVVDVYDGEVFVDCRPVALAAAAAIVAAAAAKTV